MPEWRRELDQRLAALALDPARAAEIVEELSQYLTERHAELLAGGASAEEAERQTRAELREGALVRNLAGTAKTDGQADAAMQRICRRAGTTSAPSSMVSRRPTAPTCSSTPRPA